MQRDRLLDGGHQLEQAHVFVPNVDSELLSELLLTGLLGCLAGRQMAGAADVPLAR
jgi:hypothetical protein